MDENNGIMESILPVTRKRSWGSINIYLTMGFTFHKLIDNARIYA